jgi:tetratricopeptide (TPR) repeat protein
MIRAGLAREGADRLRRALETGQVDPTEESFARSTCAEALFALALEATEKGRTSEAAAGYARAIEVEPGNADAHINLAALRLAQGEAREAAVLLRSGLVRRPDHAGLWVALGVALFHADSLDAVLQAAGRALDLDARSADAGDLLLNVGASLFQRGEPDRAEAAFRTAIDREVVLPDASYNLGVLLLRTGRPGPAARALEEALRHDPGHTRARDLLRQAREGLQVGQGASRHFPKP